MAYCAYCGKKLMDGETCSCQQNIQENSISPEEMQSQDTVTSQEGTESQEHFIPKEQGTTDQQNKVGIEAKNVIKALTGTFKDPIQTTISYVDEGSFIGSFLAIGGLAIVLIIANVLRVLFTVLTVSDQAKIFGIKLSQYLIFAGLDIHWYTFLQGIVFPIIYLGIMIGVTLILMLIVNTLITKTEFDFGKIMNGCASIVIGVAVLPILSLINSQIKIDIINIMIGAISVTVRIFVITQLISMAYYKIKSKKKMMLTVMIVTFGLVLTNYVLCDIINGFTMYFIPISLFY